MKCLRAVCGNNVLLFDLDKVVEVLDAGEKPDESNQKILWKDYQISYIDISKIFKKINGKTQNSRNKKYVVVAPSSDIDAGEYKNAQMVAVDDVEQLVDLSGEDSHDSLNFNNSALSALIEKGIYDESLDAIQLYLKLPLNVPEITEAQFDANLFPEVG